jgi:hypothetical protein
MSINPSLIMEGAGGTRSMEVIITLLFARAGDVYLTDVAHNCSTVRAHHFIATEFFDELDFAFWTSPHHRLASGFFHLVTSSKPFVVLDLFTSSGQMRSLFALAACDKAAVWVLTVEDTVNVHWLAYGLEITEWAHLKTLYAR